MNKYKIRLLTEDGKELFYNENYNFFSEGLGTVYTNKVKAAQKLSYAKMYGTTLAGKMDVVKENETNNSNRKRLTVKFSEINYQTGNAEWYEIIIFSIPNELEIDIRKESEIFSSCDSIINDYDCESENDLAQAFEEYEGVTEKDLKIAKDIIDYDRIVSAGLTAKMYATFIKEKYPETDWYVPNLKCDLEVQI